MAARPGARSCSGRWSRRTAYSRRPDGDGQCHGLCLDPAVDPLHRLFLSQARGCPRSQIGARVVTMDDRTPPHRLRRRTLKVAPFHRPVPGHAGRSACRASGSCCRRCGPQSRSWRSRRSGSRPNCRLDAYVPMFSGVGQGGIPVMQYFRNSLIISVTSTRHRARHRHGRRLCLRALPVQGQVG